MAKVVVIDDEGELLNIYERLLSHKGHSVRTFLNGRIAWEYLQTNGADLVITDHRMPEMDGQYLIGLIRTKYPEMPVILITGFGELNLGLSGPSAVVGKPVTAVEFFAAVSKALK